MIKGLVLRFPYCYFKFLKKYCKIYCVIMKVDFIYNFLSESYNFVTIIGISYLQCGYFYAYKHNFLAFRIFTPTNTKHIYFLKAIIFFEIGLT